MANSDVLAQFTTVHLRFSQLVQSFVQRLRGLCLKSEGFSTKMPLPLKLH